MEPIVSRTLSVHKEHELLQKLEAAGLNDPLAQKVIESKHNDLAVKVVRLIQNGGFESTTSQKQAREIMGSFFGIEEAIKHFGVNPSKPQLSALAEIPFSEGILKECKDTHILVAVFPLSILNIQGKANKLFYNKDWCNKQSFAEDRGETEWRLVRKTPVDYSTGKSWGEQRSLLPENEEMPTSRIMVYTIIGHFLVTGEQLFRHAYVRCSDLASDGRHVCVGGFDSDGLYFNYRWDNGRDDYVGLASARKSE